MTSISVNEVGPRDGLQSFPMALSVAEREQLVRSLVDAGVREIELTSFVHPKAVPQHADAELLCEAVADLAPAARFSAYVPNSRGFERALECEAVTKMGFAVGATDELTEHNTRATTADAIAEVEAVVARARERGVETMGAVSAALGCPFTGEVAPDRVVAVAAALLDAGFETIQIADTIGTGTPAGVTALGEALAERFPGVRVSWHFHDTFGLGIANALTAAEFGYTEFDASVGGVGGCPFAPGAAGNVASEELRRAFAGRWELSDDVDMLALAAIGRTLRDWVGDRALSKLARVGDLEWRDRFLAAPAAG